MKSREHVAFSWRPESPITAFSCAVITEASEVPRRAFAVAVTAVDADGEHVAPLDSDWPYSSALKSHYRYTPATTDAGTAVLAPWRSDVYFESVEIRVVAWLPDDETPDVAAVAVSPLADTDAHGRSWSIVRRGKEEAA